MVKINTCHGGSRGLDNLNSVNKEENPDLTGKFFQNIVPGTSEGSSISGREITKLKEQAEQREPNSRHLAVAKKTFNKIVKVVVLWCAKCCSETPKEPPMTDRSLCLSSIDNWCKKSIDELQILNNQLCDLLKNYSKKFENYIENPKYEILEWVMLRIRWGDLLKSLKSELIKHEPTITDLISQPPFFGDRMPQVCDLRDRVSYLHDSLNVFHDQYVERPSRHPQILIAQLRNLKDWIGDIKKRVASDWKYSQGG